jgi:hypothetical protein
MSNDPQQRSSSMDEADTANGEGGPDESAPTGDDPDAPGLAAAAPDWPEDPAEPNEPG